jgi:hypothetical protein
MKPSRRGHCPRKAPKGADCLFLEHINYLNHFDHEYIS